MPEQAEQRGQQPPDLLSTWAHGPYATPTGPPTWVPPLVQRRRRRRWPFLLGGALVVALLVGAGLFLFRDDPLTLGGRSVTDPAAVLADADDVLAGYVQDRHGAATEDSRCWFQLADPAGHEVQDTLACGPVLFVDGDADRSWLRFPLTATADGGRVRLSVAALPLDPAPTERPDADLLHRPDGGDPPAGTGGLEVPAPARVEAGWSATGPFADVVYSPPAGAARLSGPAAAVTITGLARPDRVGAGDDARRAARGQRLLAVRYVITPGEGLSTAAPTLSYQADGADPVPVPPALVSSGRTVEAVLSVPEDAGSVDLVVDDAGVQQRLSLLTGAPAADNLQVLARTHRVARVDAAQQLAGTLSTPGRAPASLPFTVAVAELRLAWSAGADGATHPAGPDRALLLLDASLALPGSPPGVFPVQLLELTLPDGTVVPASDLDADPEGVLGAFDVPADLTAGVLGFGGVGTFPDGAVADFGAGRVDFPFAVPAG